MLQFRLFWNYTMRIHRSHQERSSLGCFPAVDAHNTAGKMLLYHREKGRCAWKGCSDLNSVPWRFVICFSLFGSFLLFYLHCWDSPFQQGYAGRIMTSLEWPWQRNSLVIQCMWEQLAAAKRGVFRKSQFSCSSEHFVLELFCLFFSLPPLEELLCTWGRFWHLEPSQYCIVHPCFFSIWKHNYEPLVFTGFAFAASYGLVCRGCQLSSQRCVLQCGKDKLASL